MLLTGTHFKAKNAISTSQNFLSVKDLLLITLRLRCQFPKEQSADSSYEDKGYNSNNKK